MKKIKTYINYRFFSGDKRRTLNKPPILLTVAAANRIHDLILLKNPVPLGIQIGIRKRGCNGLSFTMNYVMNHSEITNNILVNSDNGVRLYIEPHTLFIIIGTVMDWTDDNISQEFTFKHPKSKGSCGCGESFSL